MQSIPDRKDIRTRISQQEIYFILLVVGISNICFRCLGVVAW